MAEASADYLSGKAAPKGIVLQLLQDRAALTRVPLLSRAWHVLANVAVGAIHAACPGCGHQVNTSPLRHSICKHVSRNALSLGTR